MKKSISEKTLKVIEIVSITTSLTIIFFMFVENIAMQISLALVLGFYLYIQYKYRKSLKDEK